MFIINRIISYFKNLIALNKFNKVLKKYDGRKAYNYFFNVKGVSMEEAEEILESFSNPKVSLDIKDCSVVLDCSKETYIKFIFSRDGKILRYWGSTYTVKNSDIMDVVVYGTSLTTGDIFIVYLKLTMVINKLTYMFPITVKITEDLTPLLNGNENSK